MVVIVTAIVIAVGYLAQYIFPVAAMPLFLVAAAIGTFPVARRAFAALRTGSVFTIEMLMTIAVVGAIALGAYEEGAIVVCLFAVGELLEGVAAGRARSGIKAHNNGPFFICTKCDCTNHRNGHQHFNRK